jgi:hypothetical protein
VITTSNPDWWQLSGCFAGLFLPATSGRLPQSKLRLTRLEPAGTGDDQLVPAVQSTPETAAAAAVE